jgi:hypothetical protein
MQQNKQLGSIGQRKRAGILSPKAFKTLNSGFPFTSYVALGPQHPHLWDFNMVPAVHFENTDSLDIFKLQLLLSQATDNQEPNQADT